MGEQAMAGVKVLDLTEHIAGPYCTKFLADYGAEVIKVERPNGGDRARKAGPFPCDKPDPEKSGLFLHLNTNKKGVTLNLDTKTGQEMFKRLAEQADLVVEDFGPGGMAERGLAYETLAAANPKLVMMSISDYGTTGPYRDYKLTDLIAYAISGFMYPVGDPDKPPLQPAGDYVYYITGQFAAVGCLSALMHSLWTGKGQLVSLSVMEAMVSALIYDTLYYSYNKALKMRTGNRRNSVAISIQPCLDGHVGIYVGPGEQRWQDFFTVLLDRPDLAEDPRMQTNDGRIAHADELEEVIRDWLKDKKSEDVFHLGQALRLLFAPIPTTAEILELEQHKARGYFREADHPVAGRLTYTGPFFRMGEPGWELKSTAPLLGQHNGEVYGEGLGLSAAEIARLRQVGII